MLLLRNRLWKNINLLHVFVMKLQFFSIITTVPMMIPHFLKSIHISNSSNILPYSNKNRTAASCGASVMMIFHTKMLSKSDNKLRYTILGRGEMYLLMQFLSQFFTNIQIKMFHRKFNRNLTFIFNSQPKFKWRYPNRIIN